MTSINFKKSRSLTRRTVLRGSKFPHTGFLLLCLVWNPFGPSAQQIIDIPPPLSIQFRCPTYPVSAKTPVTLFGDILGTEDPERLKGISFRWNISGAKLLNGQSTRQITFRADDTTSGKGSVKVRLQVEGGPPELRYDETCVLTIDPTCSLTPSVDLYSGISIDDEHDHLDRFAEYLRKSTPGSIGYIVSYAGRSACIYESEWRAKRALQYLVSQHNIPSAQIVIVEGGFRENWTLELLIQPSTGCGPLPAPTISRVEARVKGECR